MDQRGSYEKLSIRDSARSLKKYGSTNRHTVRENYIKHIIQTGDTLQGIALKYGVTMEQIRRANRLYTTDSLFLREYLLIPETENNSDKKTDLQNNHVPTSPNSVDNTENVSDFLGKIDAAIANTKKELKRVQVNSKFTGAQNSFSANDPSSSFRRNTNGDANSIFTTPKTMVVTQDHKVRTSIKRHEWQQDELFEL